MKKRVVVLLLLGLLAIGASAFEDVEDVLRLDSYWWPYSEIVIHGIGAAIIVFAIVYAYRAGRESATVPG